MGDIIPNTRFVRTATKASPRMRKKFARRTAKRNYSKPGPILAEPAPYQRRW